MLSDLLTSLTTPLSAHIRTLGYLGETLAMRKRSKRNRDAWLPHLANTRRFVLSAAEKCGNRSKVVVLGSGLLLDVPLAELSALFRKVVLADVVCLPEIRQQIKEYPNVTFAEHDVTGVAEKLCHNSRLGVAVLPEPANSASTHNGAGLVVSLNILSQLWVVPRAFIRTHLRTILPEQVDDWCTRIVEAHHSALRALGCDVCLVGDHEFVKRDRDGSIISRGSTVFDLRLPKPDEHWTWNIMPPGTGDPHVSKELIVGAWHFPAQPGGKNAGRQEGTMTSRLRSYPPTILPS